VVNGASDRRQHQAQRQRRRTATAAVFSDSIQNGPMQARWPAPQWPSSGLWVEQPPRHGSDLIEGLKGSVGIDDSSLSEELQVTVDLLG